MSSSACRKKRFPSGSKPSNTKVTRRSSRIGSTGMEPEEGDGAVATAFSPSTCLKEARCCSTPSSKTWTSPGWMSWIVLPFLSRNTMSSVTSWAFTRREGRLAWFALACCGGGAWEMRLHVYVIVPITAKTERFIIQPPGQWLSGENYIHRVHSRADRSQNTRSKAHDTPPGPADVREDTFSLNCV